MGGRVRDIKEIFYQQDKDNWLTVWYFPEEQMLRVYFNGYMADEISVAEEEEQPRLKYIIDRQGARVEV